MGAKRTGIEPNAADPIGDQTGILTRRHALPRPSMSAEQELARFLAGGSQVVVNGLPGLLGDFEPDRNARLFLPDGGAIDGVSMGRDVVDLESHDIATAQLAVDGEIEHRQISGASLDLQLGPDRPNMLWSQRGLCPDQLAFVPGGSFGGSEIRIVFVLHGLTPRLLRMTIMRRALKPQARHQFPPRTGFEEKDRTRF